MMLHGELSHSPDADDEECHISNYLDMHYKKKKKKKNRHADTEAAKEIILEKDLYVTHHKKRRKYHHSHSEDSKIFLEVLQNVPELESHNLNIMNTTGQRLRACSAGENLEDTSLPVSVAKVNHRRWVGDDSDGNKEDAVEENTLQTDSEHCIFHVKRHKKMKRKKTHSGERGEGCATTSDGEIADTLENPLKMGKRHKISKRKSFALGEASGNCEADDDGSSNQNKTLITTNAKGQYESDWHTDDLTQQNGFDCDPIGGEDHEIQVAKPTRATLQTESVKRKRTRRINECDPEQTGPEKSLSDTPGDNPLKTKPKKSKCRKVSVDEDRTSEDVVQCKLSERPAKIEKKRLFTEEQRKCLVTIPAANDDVHSSRKKKKKKKKLKKRCTSDELEVEQSVLGSESEAAQGDVVQIQLARTGVLEEILRKKINCKSSDYRIVTVSEVYPSDDCIDDRKALSRPASVGLLPSQGSLAHTHNKKKKKKHMGTEKEATAAEARSYTTVDSSLVADIKEEHQPRPSRECEYETALCQLEELIPDIRSKNPHTIKDLLRHDLRRFQQFKKQGVPIRYGRFSTEENEQIRKNMVRYLEVTGIDTADKVMHTMRYPEEAKAILEVKKRYLVSDYLAVGIPRPCKHVTSRAHKMFDLHNYKGRYTPEQTDQLLKLHATCGNNWNQISDRVGRSRLSVALKYSQLRNPVNQGPWSKEEKKKLMQAVKRSVVGSQSREMLENMASKIEQSSHEDIPLLVREQLYKGISWVEVAAEVGTRNWMQCKLKWNTILTKKMTRGVKVFHGPRALQAKIRIIQRLYESRVEDSSELNWEELAECIGDVPPAYVQSKFYKLKARNVPSWHMKTFPEIVDHLHEETLPKLQRMLEKMIKKNVAEETQQETQKVFQFTDIFQDSEEDASEPEEE